MSKVNAVDLFAGAGGTSTGLALACKALKRDVKLIAINHWLQAIETHKANHPWAEHFFTSVESVDPRGIVPSRHLNILVASPECTHFSRAAGGRPKRDQKRSSAWQILRWLELLEVDSLLVENVPEFATWGPLDRRGQPVKAQKGEIYESWISAIRSFGYTVDTKVLNAADYGAPTSRSRLFVAAHKGKKPIEWPRPTNSQQGVGKKRWHPAREIIDWSIPGQSIYTRKRPLSPNTMRRIIEGLKRFGGDELRPFIVLMEHGGGVKDLADPLPTITTAKGGSMAIADPFVLSQGSGGAPRSVKRPLPTIPAGGAHALVEPFVIATNGERKGQRPRVRAVADPLPTVTSRGIPLVDGFLLPVRGYFGQNTPKSIDEPLGTITQRGYGGVVRPFIVRFNGTPDSPNKDTRRAFDNSAKSVDDPLPTVTGGGRLGIAQAEATKNHFGLADYLVQYNGQSEAQSVEEPLPTISTRDRFGLVQPQVEGQLLDIRFRMLQPHELAAAMGFPRGYKFTGTKTEVVKQIGNAVVVDVAKALCLSLLR